MMATVPAKASTRIVSGLKRFQPILANAKSRDVNESDTVLIITDMLQEVFGYDKFVDVTSEHAIRGTYCDLAIKLEGVLKLLIEVKAIGLELKDSYVKQAVDYAANQGVDWVALTNGIVWRIYKIHFTKPIENELVLEFNISSLNAKSDDDIEFLFIISKESWQKASLGEYHAQKQALSRYTLSAILLGETMLEVLRREVRRASPGIKIETAEIKKVLEEEIIKREVLEGEKAIEARKFVSRAANKVLRVAKTNSSTTTEILKPESKDSPATEAVVENPEQRVES